MSGAPATGAEAGEKQARLVVVGGGPGGYTAAFRAADLGLQVVLVDDRATLGGVCLNVGCIPSKTLLHAASVVEQAAAMASRGIVFDPPRIDLPALKAWKEKVVAKLTGGLAALARQRKVEVVRGAAKLAGPNLLEVTADGASQRIRFEQCILAAGSRPASLPFLPDDPRVMDSTGALELASSSGRLLVIGGGIIGLEMACVYDALGAKVTVVEMTPGLLPGCDPDLVAPLSRRISKRYEKILLATKVTAVEAADDGLHVTFEGKDDASSGTFDQVLVSIGRLPNGKLLDAEAAGVVVDERGFIPSDRQMRTNVAHIFSIGDLAGGPMLAHKASHEGRVAAEAAAGLKSFFDAKVVPSVAYTDPEVAWVGLTELDAKAQGIAFEKSVFPWAASARALSVGREEGFTKILFDPVSHRVLGGAIVGVHAGELISEIALAVEMGADAADLALTIHPHPTLSESLGMTAEMHEGTITDLYAPRKKAPR
ncbi:MAG: dihydrolipoyl dehydrogenase [Candidatus Binatia bacterium]